MNTLIDETKIVVRNKANVILIAFHIGAIYAVSKVY